MNKQEPEQQQYPNYLPVSTNSHEDAECVCLHRSAQDTIDVRTEKTASFYSTFTARAFESFRTVFHDSDYI